MIAAAALVAVLAFAGPARAALGPALPRLDAAAPPQATLDLWRARPDHDKRMVEATLPGGVAALFLVDTGASVSSVHADLAAAIGLRPVAGAGWVEGLSGRASWRLAVLPSLSLGPMTLRDVRVAVGLPGVPARIGALPLAGILGNNVWSAFTLDIDAAHDRMRLWRPPAGPRIPDIPKHRFDFSNLHVTAPMELVADDGTRAAVPLAVDTGAPGVTVLGAAGAPLTPSVTWGEEFVVGIGGDTVDVPAHTLLERTGRAPLRAVRVVGRRLRAAPGSTVMWLRPGDEAGPSGLPGLLGQSVLDGRRLIIDYARGVWDLRPTLGRRRFDARRAWLALEQARGGPDDPARAVTRVRIYDDLGETDAAAREATASARAFPTNVELRCTQLVVLRRAGRSAEAATEGAAAPPAALVEGGCWIQHVGGVATIDPARAVAVAQDAWARVPSTVDTERRDRARRALGLALADALATAGRASEARAIFRQTPMNEDEPVREARYAALDGDREAALVALRRGLRTLPMSGAAARLYAELATDAHRPTFDLDLAAAMARLHPDDRPLDALAATAPDADRRAAARREGAARDCARAGDAIDRDNCRAWYAALGPDPVPDGVAAALKRALAAAPHRADVADTAALVAWRSGDVAEARRLQRVATELSPGDPAMWWQLDRYEGKLP